MRRYGKGLGWALIVWCTGGLPASAFDAPVDKAGPLTVRIEGPAEVTQLDTPIPVRVHFQNQGSEPLKGTIELAVTDRWSASPAQAQPFSAPAKGTAVVDFTVRAGAGSFTAFYPIHAYAKFNAEGRDQTAHPILIVATKFPTPPTTEAPLEWRPFAVPQNGQLAIWRLPVQRALIQVFGQPPRTMPVGWTGTEDSTAASFGVRRQPLGNTSREAIAIHPPWRDGRVGTALVEFPLTLPAQAPLRLEFDNAVNLEGQGDGVTFRVRALPLNAPDGQLGEVLFERHVAPKRKSPPAQADLSRFAGQAIRLQLESHPGPKNNTTFDQSYWVEPTLHAGTSAPATPFPPKSTADSIALGTIRNGGSTFEVRLIPGSRGLLDSVVGFVSAGKAIYFRGFEIRVLGSRIDDARSPIALASAKSERTPAGYVVRHHFNAAQGEFDLVGELAVNAGALQAKFRLENAPPPQSWQTFSLGDVALGPWSVPARQVYAGTGNVVRGPGPFTLGFDGHRLATSFIGIDFQSGQTVVQAVDLPPTNFEVRPGDNHYSLHTPHALMYSLIPAPNAFDGVKVWREINGLKPSGGVSKAAGRFVIDLWGGRYADSAAALRRAFRYGLGDSMVIWHSWQRWGYDYRLPDINPPDPRLGTLDEFKDLIAACKEAKTLFAVHDNYIDFYPDADDFSYERNIAFNADRKPARAWLNEGRNAQSYRYRSDQIAPFVQRNVSWLRANLAPTAYFIDVWSSAGPYDYWTSDGKFFDRLYTRKVWGEQFAWIRDTLGDNAPQLSESGHDQLIGWLDGATTNHIRAFGADSKSRDGHFTWNWPCADAERTPWFDAAHHDRFILHGAGYSGRYEAGLDRRLHGIASDDYISTEVLTGHPAMVQAAFSTDVVRKHWLLNDLMKALALRRIEAVEFADDNLHRQHVRWSGGGEVWVNRGESDWQVAGHTLPQYGFYAKVPTESGAVEASIERRDTLIVELARSPSQTYVNGRAIVEGPARILPRAVDYRSDGGRKFSLALQWQAEDPIPQGYRPFLHVCDDRGEIVAQLSQDPASIEGRTGAIRALAQGQLPESVKPGTTLEVRAGLYHPSGPRLALHGPEDGQGRIRLGQLRVEGTGANISKLSWLPHRVPPDPSLARQNPAAKAVDFGAVVTSGNLRVTRDATTLVLTPLPAPAGKTFEARLRWKDLPWTLPAPVQVEAIAEDGKVLGREPVKRAGDFVVVKCRSDVFQYRLLPQ